MRRVALAVVVLALSPPALACEVPASGTTLDLPIDAGGVHFTVRIEVEAGKVRPLDDRVELLRPLELETTGALGLPLHLLRMQPLPHGLGRVGPDEKLALSSKNGTLRAAVELGYGVSLGPIDLPCDALELPKKATRRHRPEAPDPFDAMFAQSKGTWSARTGLIRVHAAPKDDSPFVELHHGIGELLLEGLGSSGDFIHAGIRRGSAVVIGYIASGDLEPYKPDRGGAGMIGGGGCGDAEDRADFAGPATVAGRTRILAAPGGAAWATLPQSAKLEVRWNASGAQREWVRIRAIPGVHELSAHSFRSECEIALAHAFVPRSAVDIPDAAAIERRAAQARPPALTPAALAERRKRLGLDGSDAIATQDDLGCVVKNGRVRCWGDVPGAGRDDATELPGVDDAIAVALPWSSVCALRRSGGVVCLGRWPQRETPRFTPLPGVDDGVALQARMDQLCVVRRTGQLLCGVAGKLDPVDGIDDALAVTIGRGHVCALRASGVSCFGSNDAGQLGAGDRKHHVGLVDVKLIGEVVRLAAGYDHTCALRKDGSIACFGRNSSGELGEWRDDTTRPLVVKAKGWREISAGDGYTCGLGPAGGECFGGLHSQRALFAGDSSYQGRPASIGGLGDAQRIALGGQRACVLTQSGEVRCWGERKLRRPVKVAAVLGVRRLRAGHEKMCALLDKGELRCWPKSRDDRDPYADPNTRDFVLVAGGMCRLYSDGKVSCDGRRTPPGDGPASAISMSTGMSCALRGGKPACQTDEGPLPLPVDTFGEAVGIAATFHGVCVVEKSGRVVCVHQDTDERKPPTARVLPGVADAVEVAVEISSVCVRRKSGKVSCDGEQGMVDIGPVTDATAIAVSGVQLCALRRDGTLWCAERRFGRGERGFGAFAQVEGVRDAVELALDQATACTRDKRGEVWCYGRCDGGRCDGQLGPVAIPGTR